MLGLTLDILRAKVVGITGGGPAPPPYTPPLDAYTNTVVAYSVRKLSSSYSGPCMQIRRASDSTTLDIGFDSNGLVKTADIAAFCAGSVGTVSIWYDQGSLGQNATATTSIEPTIYSGTAFYYVNGYPTVRANGVNVRFDDVISHTGDWCNLFIMSSNSLSGPFSTSYTIGPTSEGAVFGSDANSFMLSSGGNVTVPGYGNIQSIHAIFSNASRLQYTRNAVGDVTAGGMTGRTYDSFLLRRNTDNASMNMQEWIMWDSDLIAAQSTLETNLNEYYQVTNLPYYTSGFLADYSGAAAAYSVRKLSNTAIKCMRVRRNVPPYDELDIGFTPAGDLDEQAIVAFGAGNPLVVSRWYDQSGQSNHAVQDTPSLQPQIYNGTAVITDNGKPALSCNLDRFELGSTISLTSGYSAIHVSQQSGRDSASFGTSFNYNYVTLYQNTNVWFYHNTAGQTIPYIVPLNTQQLHWLNWTGSTVGIGIDGGALSTGALSASASINRLLNAAGNNQQGWRGLVQEMIVYPTDKNAAGQRPAIETNINTYYSVYPTSGFLVDYPGAKAAYSLRKLQNVQQYAIQVQRTTGANDTLDIGFDVNGDLDTQAIIDFGGSDTLGVSIWYDQSRTGNHLTSGLGNQPIIYNGVSVITEGSRPALSFDKTANQDLQKQLPSGINILDMGSFLVCKSSATPHNHPAGLFLGSTASQEQNMLAYRTGQIFYNGATTGGTLGNTNYNLFSLYSDNASSDVKGYLNGSQLLTGTPTSVAINYLTVGAFGTVVGTEWDGTIQEAIVFGTSTKAVHTAIESNIQTYYGTP